MHEHQSNELETQLLTHLVESAGMKSDIEHIKGLQADLTHRVLVSLGEVAGDIKAIRADLQAVPERIQACRVDVKREVEKEFPNRVDAIEMEKRIEKQVEITDRKLADQITAVQIGLTSRIDTVEKKVENVWIKITTAIAVLAAVAGSIAWAIDNLSIGIGR